MYICYIDDSGSTGLDLENPQAQFQVLGGPVISDQIFSDIELWLSYEVEQIIPDDQWDSFEFHTRDLFNAQPPFHILGTEKCRDLLKTVLEQLKALEVPIVCGAFDKPKLNAAIYASADPADMAFKLYLQTLKVWLENEFLKTLSTKMGRKVPRTDVEFIVNEPEIGMLIADEGNKRMRQVIESEFHRRRKRVRLARPEKPESDIYRFLIDDVNFGNSKNSLGIQLADVCSYFIARHLAEKADSEGFYDTIKGLVHLQVFPE